MALNRGEAAAPMCCPICRGATFGPGPRGRSAPNGAMPRCTRCGSLERHRISRIMFDRLGPGTFAGWSAIQFSPDPTVDPAWFGSFELSVYGEPGGIDIQATDLSDARYDYVGCSHVLEHVGDDGAALRELVRIAARDGLVYLSVPDPVREPVTRDWGFPKPEKFGHWRVYGRDIGERFGRHIPGQPVLAYFGQDPVTGEWADAFLLPRSTARYRWVLQRLGESVKPIAEAWR
jgi:SAM-dependent methyltransferase